MRALYVNEDNQSFYASHAAEQMTAAEVDRLVDIIATDTQVGGIHFCTNHQRALFASDVWEAWCAGYEPERHEYWERVRGTGVGNLWLLIERGIDHHARWLARCRHHGIEGWLSIRVNDCHYLKEHLQREREDAPGTEWPGTLWRRHPEWRRAPYRWERSWESAFDFKYTEVRKHHLALIAELCERYDMFGIELDWLRWGMMFAPGDEASGTRILTHFMQEARALANGAAARLGHPVQVAVRIPYEPQHAMALGFDVPTWAEQKLIDRVIISSFLGAGYLDYPIALWRRLLGDDIRIIAHAEPVWRAWPGAPGWTESRAFTYGAAASAWQRGADGIYLFNHCVKLNDQEGLAHKAEHHRHLGDPATTRQLPRRHAVSYPQVYAAGQAPRALLPIPLTNPVIGSDFGRMEQNITLRIPLGGVPTHGQVCLQLGLDDSAPPLTAEELGVRVNGVPCKARAVRPAPFGARDPDRKGTVHGEVPDGVAQALLYDVPLPALNPDDNAVEFVPPAVPGALVWAEFLVVPGAAAMSS